MRRYCHLHPEVSKDELRSVLGHQTSHFRWAGCDTFMTIDASSGKKQTLVVETNSCPSGQKSTPWMSDNDEMGGYKRLVATTFKDLLREADADNAACDAEIHAPTVGSHGDWPSTSPASSSSAVVRPSTRSESIFSCASEPSSSPASGNNSATGSPADTHRSKEGEPTRSSSVGADPVDLSIYYPSTSSSTTGIVASSVLAEMLQPPAQVLASATGVADAEATRALAPPLSSAPFTVAAAGSDSRTSTIVGRSASNSSSQTASEKGVLAVVYDKNVMEASGYAAAIAEETGESVYLCEWYLTDTDAPVRFDPVDQRMYVRHPTTAIWMPVRAAFRYVTQKPWTRLPVSSRTRMLNPILPCIAGGRNKLIAARAYADYNSRLNTKGVKLAIQTPETICDVNKEDIPSIVGAMGGVAVIKVPYGNAGQGVYTVTNGGELDAFMAEPHAYGKFIVQSLVGGSGWTSTNTKSSASYFHAGTVPNQRHEVFACDVRMMVSTVAGTGFQPLAMYARRAADPLSDAPPLDGGASSWRMLGTNLSVMTDDLTWSTESERLLLMDKRDFSTLGIGLDELIDAYIQTVMAVTAIDDMCERVLVPLQDAASDADHGAIFKSQAASASSLSRRTLGRQLDVAAFSALNDDPALVAEIKL